MKTRDSKAALALIVGGLVVMLGFYLSDPRPTPSPPQALAPSVEASADMAPRPAEPPPLDGQEAAPVDAVEADVTPADDAQRARQPKEGAEWELLKVPLLCDVEPPPVQATVEGMLHPVTWPGPDHEPQDGGMNYPPVPSPVTIEEGVLTGRLWLPVVKSRGEAVRHVARLVIPGFAETEFSFLTLGPDESAECSEAISLDSASSGVVGSVRLADGSSVVGAIVSGCGARTVAGSDGDYFLLPRSEEACTLRARHAPGTSVQSDPHAIDPSASSDHVVDFVIEVPDRPQPGVTLTRDDAGEVWAHSESSDDPWARYLLSPAVIVRVGDVPASTLSDEELWLAMTQLDSVIHLQQHLESDEGQQLIVNQEVAEL